jgi:hypothetical protein
MVVRIGVHSVRIRCGFWCALQPKKTEIPRLPSLSPSYSPSLISPDGSLRTKRKEANLYPGKLSRLLRAVFPSACATGVRALRQFLPMV